MTDLALLADVGGTNTRVALAQGGLLLPDSLKSYKNDAFDGLADVLRTHLRAFDRPKVRAICAGVAGPVQGDSAQLTNRDWHITAQDLCAATDAASAYLINDLQAQGYALNDLPQSAIQTVIGTPTPPGTTTRAVLNLGTGCNIAVVHQLGDQLIVPAAETGHSALPVATGRLGALFAHLQEASPHAPIEAVLSGPGLARLHLWTTGQTLTGPEVMQAADQGDPSARDSAVLFAHALGHITGNFALHHLPLGGLFLSGSLARAIAPYLADSEFHAALCQRGPYTELVSQIPISVITTDDFALLGCARYLSYKM